jgi:hypothetical protein
MKTLGCTLILFIALIFLIKNKALTQITVTKQLRFDGMYNGQKYAIGNFLVFLENDRVYLNSHRLWSDTPSFNEDFFIDFTKFAIGSYTIKGDSIYATIPTSFYISGMRSKYLPAHYHGYIKSRDSIIGWRMVAPYPKFNHKLNREFDLDTIPRNLHFVSYQRVKQLEQYVK